MLIVTLWLKNNTHDSSRNYTENFELSRTQTWIFIFNFAENRWKRRRTRKRYCHTANSCIYDRTRIIRQPNRATIYERKLGYCGLTNWRPCLYAAWWQIRIRTRGRVNVVHLRLNVQKDCITMNRRAVRRGNDKKKFGVEIRRRSSRKKGNNNKSRRIYMRCEQAWPGLVTATPLVKYCLFLYSCKKEKKSNANRISECNAREQFNFKNVAAKISRLRSCIVLRDELHPRGFFCGADETTRSYYRRRRMMPF